MCLTKTTSLTFIPDMSQQYERSLIVGLKQQISYQINSNKTMLKKEKKGTAVARSKFIDRIKSHAQLQGLQKENLNVNDIRESSYKLPRSRSNTRYDHSLERKSPIKINQQNVLHTQLRNSNEAIKQYLTDGQTISNTFKLTSPGYTTQGKQDHFDQHQEGNQNLQHSRHPSKQQLQDEEESLNMIKVIWQNTSRLKEKYFFRTEMSQIQGILKDIIIQMARPKFNASHDQSLEAMPVKFSPFHNLQSESKHCSSYNSASRFLKSGKYNEQSVGNTAQESDREEEIEFKKIMYILEDKSKYAKSPTLDESASMRQVKVERELREISDILNVKSCQSSFNCSSRDPAQTIREFDKVNNSRSNDRIFLKNIVKKAKNSASSVEESEKLSHSKQSLSELNYSREKSNHIISQQFSQEDSNNHQSTLQPQPQLNNFYYSRQGSDPIKIQTLETVQDESQSKRAVLNQIISMLNKKYHKNIKLEPRKF